MNKKLIILLSLVSNIDAASENEPKKKEILYHTVKNTFHYDQGKGLFIPDETIDNVKTAGKVILILGCIVIAKNTYLSLSGTTHHE